jgi:hypothetical protein
MTFGSIAETDLIQDSASDSFTNFDLINNSNFTANREVLADLHDGVTYPLHGARVLSLIPRSKNSTIQDPELEDSADSTYHQICVLTASGRGIGEDEKSEAFDPLGNPYVDLVDLMMGTGNKYVAAQPRDKVQLSKTGWDRTTRAINGTEPMTMQASTEELTYQYKLSRARCELQKIQEILDARKAAADASSERRANLSAHSGKLANNHRDHRGEQGLGWQAYLKQSGENI